MPRLVCLALAASLSLAGLSGCSAGPDAMSEQAAPSIVLEGREWIVESIAPGGIIDRTVATLTFDAAQGRVSGSASCNRYTAGYTVSGNTISFGNAATTRKLCPPAIMDQERRFLEVLGDVTRFRADETGALILSTDDGREILARR